MNQRQNMRLIFEEYRIAATECDILREQVKMLTEMMQLTCRICQDNSIPYPQAEMDTLFLAFDKKTESILQRSAKMKDLSDELYGPMPASGPVKRQPPMVTEEDIQNILNQIEQNPS